MRGWRADAHKNGEPPGLRGRGLLSMFRPLRTGGRAVEGTALEMRSTFTGIVGSNPTLSAIVFFRNIKYLNMKSRRRSSEMPGGPASRDSNPQARNHDEKSFFPASL